MARDFSRNLREYTVWSRPEPHLDLPPIESPEPQAVSASVAERYRKYPASLTRVRELADQVVGDPATAEVSVERQTADRLIAFLRDSGEYNYSLQMRVADPAIDPLEDFLFNTKQGHCEYFATALAVLLRTQGIHSRLVTGYKGAVENSYSGYFEVQRRHSHAWVEAWFDGAWHTLDAVPHARDDEARQFAGNRGFWGNARDSLNSLWSNYFVTMSIDRQQTQLYGPLGRAWESVKTGTKGVMDFFRDFGSSDPSGGRLTKTRGPWLWMAVLAGLVLLRWLLQSPQRLSGRSVAGVSPHWTGLLRKMWDQWWPGGTVPQESLRLYREFLEVVGRRGFVRAEGETQQEFAGQIKQYYSHSLAAAGLGDFPDKITQLFYDSQFGGRSVETAVSARFQQQLTEFSAVIAQPIQSPQPASNDSPRESATS